MRSISFIPVALVLAPLLPAQEPDDGVTLRKLERFELYLDRKPFHSTAFDQLISLTSETGGMAALAERYEAKLEEQAEEGGEQAATRVVMARIYERMGLPEKALELLEGLSGQESEPDAELLALTAEVRASSGDATRALEELSRAIEAAGDDVELLERIHRIRGQAALAVGLTEEARAAFEDLAGLDPESFTLRSAVADELEAGGLLIAAFEAYGVAVELAGQDVARRCRALAARGRLAERLDRKAEALELYEEAVLEMRRGNWLRRDLFARALALHERTGSLEELVAHERAAIDAYPGDLDRREQLARAHLAMRDVPAALEVLASAAELFPSDLALGRLRLGAFELADDSDGRIAEYQRLLSEFPEELDLYLELGQLFASDGKLEQARIQWERTLERRVDDARLAVRIAALYAIHDLHEERARMLERALAIDSTDVEAYASLGKALRAAGRVEEIPALLDRARVALGNTPQDLELYAQIARELNRSDRAMEALEQGFEADPGLSRLGMALASAQIDAGQVSRALETYRTLLDNTEDESVIRSAVSRMTRLARGAGSLSQLQELAQEGLAVDESRRTSRFLLAELALDRNDTREARRLYEEMVAEDPEDFLAGAELAELFVAVGRTSDAIKRFEALAEIRPSRRGSYLRRVAELHLREGDSDEAVEAYRRSMSAVPMNAGALAEAAAFYRRADLHEAARAALEEALDLRADAAEIRLSYAQLLLEQGEVEAALAQARKVVEQGDMSQLDSARSFIHQRLVESGGLKEEIAGLKSALEDNPFAEAPALALIDLWKRELEYVLALELVDEMLTYQPRSIPLRLERAWVNGEMGRFDLALEDYQAVLRTEPGRLESLVESMTRCAFQLGDRAAADRFLLGQPPRVVAKIYSQNGLRAEAIELLEDELSRTPEHLPLLSNLAARYVSAGRLDDAVALERRVIELTGGGMEEARSLARKLFELGRADDALPILADGILGFPFPEEMESGSERDRRRALSRAWARYSDAIEATHNLLWELDFEDRFTDLARMVLEVRPADRVFPGMVANYASWGQANSVVATYELLKEVRANSFEKGLTPSGIELDRWGRMLDGLCKGLERESPELARRRALEMEGEEVSLTLEKITELTQLYTAQGQRAELAELMAKAATAFPDEPRWRASNAMCLMESEDWAAAATELSAALEDLPVSRLASRDAETAPSSRALSSLRKRHAEAGLSDEALTTLWRMGAGKRIRSYRWTPGARPRRDGVELALALCLGHAGDEAGARAIISEYEPPNPEFVASAARLIPFYEELGWSDDVERLSSGIEGFFDRVHQQPGLRGEIRWRSEVLEILKMRAMSRFSEIGSNDAILDEEKARRFLAVRRFGGRETAQQLLFSLDNSELLAGVRAAFEAAVERSSAGEASAALEVEDYGIALIELLNSSRDWEGAAGVCAAMAAVNPTIPNLSLTRARFLLSAGDVEGALEVAQALLQLTDEEGPERIQPEEGSGGMTLLVLDEGGKVDPHQLTLSGSYGLPTSSEFPEEIYSGRYQWSDDWRNPIHALVLEIAFEGGDYSTAAEAYSSLTSNGSSLASYTRHELRNNLLSLGLPVEALPLVEAAREKLPGDWSLAITEVDLLLKLDRKEEALEVIDEAGRISKDHVRAAQQRAKVTGVDPVEGAAEAAMTADQILAEVEAEPRSVRLRIEAASKLLEESRAGEALVQAFEAERLGPHLDEVRSLVLRAMSEARHEEGFEERVRSWVENTKDIDERLGWALLLADRAWERGELEAAVDILELARSLSPGWEVSRQGSIGIWFQMRGELGLAARYLADEISRIGSASWELRRLNPLLVDVELGLGRGDAVLRSFEAAGLNTSYGGAASSLDTHISELVKLGLHGPRGDRVRAILREGAAGLAGAQRIRIEGALDIIEGNFPGAIRRLADSAREDSSKRDLVIEAIGVARALEDWETALELLDVAADMRAPSNTNKVDTDAGLIGERDIWLIERGALHAAMGDTGSALEQWSGCSQDPVTRVLLRFTMVQCGILDEVAGESRFGLKVEEGMQSKMLLVEYALARHEGNTDAQLRWLGELLKLDTSIGEVAMSLAADSLRRDDRLDEIYGWLDSLKGIDDNLDRAITDFRIELAFERGGVDAGAKEAALLGAASGMTEWEKVRASLRFELLSKEGRRSEAAAEVAANIGDHRILKHLADGQRWGEIRDAMASHGGGIKGTGASSCIKAEALARAGEFEPALELLSSLKPGKAYADPLMSLVEVLSSTEEGRLALEPLLEGREMLTWYVRVARGQEESALELIRGKSSGLREDPQIVMASARQLFMLGELEAAADLVEGHPDTWKNRVRRHSQNRSLRPTRIQPFQLTGHRFLISLRGVDAWRDRTSGTAVLPFQKRSGYLMNSLQQGEMEYASLLLELELDGDFARLMQGQGSLWNSNLLAPGTEALVRVGEIDAANAVDALWLPAVGNPPLYGVNQEAGSFRLAIARLAEEHGLLDSCFIRLDRELEQLASHDGPEGPRRIGLEAFRGELASLTGRLEHAGGVPSSGAPTEDWLRHARLCIRSGNPEGALHALESLAGQSLDSAWQSMGAGMRAPGDVRFSFAVPQEAFMGSYLMSSAHSHFHHSRGSDDRLWREYGRVLDEQRELDVIRLIALQQLERSAEAAALEIRLLDRGGEHALVREFADLGAGIPARDRALAMSSQLGADEAADILAATARALGRDFRAADEAMAPLLEKLASLKLRSATHAHERALLFIQLGVEGEKVQRALAAVLELDPERRPPLHLRGWFALADGDLEAAQTWFERAEGLERMDGAGEGAALAGQAFVREAAGEPDAACQAARRALSRPVEPALLARLRDLARDR